MEDAEKRKAYWMQRAIDKVNQSYWEEPFKTAVQYLQNSGQWGGEIVDQFMGVNIAYGKLLDFLNKNKVGYTPPKKVLPDFKPPEENK
jgi:hypothetical protein